MISMRQALLFHHDRRRRWSRFVIPLLSLAGLAAALFWSLAAGALSLPVGTVAAVLFSPLGIDLPWSYSSQDALVVLSLRLPRALLAFGVGAGLGAAGAALQGLFRNPLADPALVGISGGAALGAIGMIVLGSAILPSLDAAFRLAALPAAAFAGGLLATAVSYRLATRHGRTLMALLLLAGIAVNAVTGALSGFLVFIASDAQLRSITFWSLGSVSSADWTTVAAIAVMTVLPSAVLLRFGRALNALALGEHEAAHLGLNVQSLKITIVVLASLAVGAGVAFCGIIGFVGLVVPHLLRLTVGADHRTLLPGSFLLGGILLMTADTLARTVMSPAELPIGIVTTGVGGPFFLWLLIRRREEETAL